MRASRFVVFQTKVRGFAKGWFPKRWFPKGGFGECSPVRKTGTRVHSDVPWYAKPERGYMRMFPGTKNRNEGTFAKALNPFTKLPFCFLSKSGALLFLPCSHKNAVAHV